MKVDIIIPIYNAYEYTVKCIESILENTDPELYHLLLINDKSTDERIVAFLEELRTKGNKQIFIYQNEVNLGFVGTVNKGMSQSSNDVILLNSDTEVTKGWIEKLTDAAYKNKRIATVTPLTNNGTICSIPNFCEDNLLPGKLSLDEYAAMVEQTSLKLYPDIPTAVGFCMYIKRSVLDEVGMFDQETFGKGYGEENDFCCRALEYGYKHILCDDTFIYHKGSTSFLGSKESLVRHNAKVLNDRYPYYDAMIQKFIHSHVMKPINDNIKFQLKIRNGKSNVLNVLHNDFLVGENHSIGGTEYQTKDIIENIEDINAYVLYVKDQEIHLQAFIDNEIFKFKYTFASSIEDMTFSSESYKKQLERILGYFNIDYIHVQHFKKHTFDIVDLANDYHIPIYLTLHDFYMICPKVNLLNTQGEYCKTTRGAKACYKCLRNEFGFYQDILPVWNKKNYEIFPKFKKIFAPSQSVKDIFMEYYAELYGELDFEIEVIEHGIQNIDVENQPKKMKQDLFKVAFIGGIAPYKGSNTIYEMIKNNQDKQIEWHIFGNIGDQKLNLLEHNQLIKHGRYERNRIEELLNYHQIDLVCILSKCPETYSYTLSEAINANKVVLVTDIGALGERVKNYQCGWTMEVQSTWQEIQAKIIKIKNADQERSEKYTKVCQIKLPSKKEIAQRYKNYYIKMNKKNIPTQHTENEMMLMQIYRNKIFTGENIENVNTEIMTQIVLENQILKEHVLKMENTIGWKLLNYLRTNFPWTKQMGKKIIYVGSRMRKR